MSENKKLAFDSPQEVPSRLFEDFHDCDLQTVFQRK